MWGRYYERIPIYVLSGGWVDEAKLRLIKEAGANDFIDKDEEPYRKVVEVILEHMRS